MTCRHASDMSSEHIAYRAPEMLAIVCVGEFVSVSCPPIEHVAVISDNSESSRHDRARYIAPQTCGLHHPGAVAAWDV